MNPLLCLAMSEAVVTSEKLDPATIIIDAAIRRFSEYGYNKTTMAEIAEDAAMSAANLYRYYKNKQDIAAVCARNYMDERLCALKEAISEPGLSATQMLEKYALTTLAITQQKAIENRKIDEICTEITRHRPDLVHHKINSEKALIMEILNTGKQRGEFLIQDIEQTAEAIHAMLVIFDVPMFMHLFSNAEYEQKARNAVQLLLPGLRGQGGKV